jgi:hypothetical protein
MKIGQRGQLVVEEKCCTVKTVTSLLPIVDQITVLQKSVTDHIALHSWNGLEEIKEI